MLELRPVRGALVKNIVCFNEVKGEPCRWRNYCKISKIIYNQSLLVDFIELIIINKVPARFFFS